MPRETVPSRNISGSGRSRGETARNEGTDRAIARMAEWQHGVIARWQLMALGMNGDAIDYRQTAALSHRSAAALWGIRERGPGVVHVTVPHKSTSTKLVRRHHVVLPRDEVTAHERIPVTTVPRTVLDLAASSSVDEVEVAIRQSKSARDEVPPVPAAPSAATTASQRLDRGGREAVPGRLPLGGHRPGRRARRLAGARDPDCAPRRPGAGSRPSSGRLRGDANYLGATR